MNVQSYSAVVQLPLLAKKKKEKVFVHINM